jgi:Bacterial Ig-like domain (group 3)
MRIRSHASRVARLAAIAVLAVATPVAFASPGASAAVVTSGSQPTKTDLLIYSRPKSPASTWTSTTRLVLVANVTKLRPVSTKKPAAGTVTFTVDGVQTVVPMVGLHHATLVLPNGLGLGTHSARAHYNGNGAFLPSTSPTRTVNIAIP